jgi:hypothetical protein
MVRVPVELLVKVNVVPRKHVVASGRMMFCGEDPVTLTTEGLS